MAVKNLKGLLLTMVMLVIFVLIVAEVLTYVAINYNYSNMATASSQGEAAATFALSMKGGYASALYQSLHNSVYGLAAYEANTAIAPGAPPINNTAGALVGLITDSTLYGTQLGTYTGQMNIASYTSYLEATARNEGINLTLSPPVISVYQTAPFILNASVSVNATVGYGAGTFTYPVFATAALNLSGAPDLLSAMRGYPQQIIPSNASARLIGNSRAMSGSTSPYLFNYGTAVFESGIPTCASVPIAMRNQNYILVTADALDIDQNVCGMGGLITYAMNAILPMKPYLLYSSSSNVVTLIDNGTRVLLSGQSLGAYNVSDLLNAVQNGYYFPSQGEASYLDRGAGNIAYHDQAGSFNFPLASTQVAQFNGSDSGISISSDRQISGARTVVAWIYVPGTYGGLGSPIVTAGPGSYTDFFGVTGENGAGCVGADELYIDHWDSPCDISAGTVRVGAWNQVAYTYDGSTVQFYINGVDEGCTGGWCNILNNYDLNTFTIGDNKIIGGTTTNTLFSGDISNVQIYSTALTSAQMSSLYQEGILARPVDNAGVVGWWPLNGNLNGYPSSAYTSATNPVAYTPLVGYAGDSISGSPISGPGAFPVTLGCTTPGACTNSSAQQILFTNYPTPAAGYFNGVNSEITIPASAGRKVASNFTLSAWVDAPTANGLSSLNPAVIVDFYGAGLFLSEGDVPCFYVNRSGDGTNYPRFCPPIGSGTTAPSGKWTLITGTYAGGIERVYMNGVLLGSFSDANIPNLIQASGTIGTCGYCNGKGGTGFDGYIADVQAYNYTLNQTAIQSLYSSGVGGAPIAADRLLAWWPLNGNAKDYARGVFGGTASMVNYGYVPSYYSPTAASLNLQGAYLPGAASFNGNGVIAIPVPLVTGHQADSLVAAWIYPTSIGGGKEDIVSSGESNGNGFSLSINANGENEADFEIRTTAGGGSWAAVSSPQNLIQPDNWYLLEGTYDGNNAALYINGNMVASTGSAGSVVQAVGTTAIGGEDNLASYLFSGDIADVKVYNVTYANGQAAASAPLNLYLNDSLGLSMAMTKSSYYWPLGGPAEGGVYNSTQDIYGFNTGYLYNVQGASITQCLNSNVIEGACGVQWVPG
jgi:hypothetical protein